jgi:hypothetical protein
MPESKIWIWKHVEKMNKKLYILVREHSDYDEHDTEIVGVTAENHIAGAFLMVGMFGDYWSHDVYTVDLNVLSESTDVQVRINEWIDPVTNPLCECGHRLMHHRRSNNTGSCKHNAAKNKQAPEGHKCKGFRLVAEQTMPVMDDLWVEILKRVTEWNQERMS